MRTYSWALADSMNRPKGLTDLTVAALYDFDWANYKTLPIYLGPEVVKIVCGEPEVPESGRPYAMTTAEQAVFFTRHIPSTFTVHKSLLCRYSRYFRNRLCGPWGSEVMADALMKIERNEGKYLSYEDVPTGYIPSWVAFVQDYRREAREASPPADILQTIISEKQAEETISLSSEPKELFTIFVHWLYTQELVLDDVWSAEDEEVVCAGVYVLAERLDVPALRQQCYQRLHSYYGENNTMPEPEVVEIIIKRCQAASLLRRYMVATIAHEVINSGSESKESCDPILALNKDFAAEVAIEIMTRLRSDESSKDPNEQVEYDVDDSDSDVSSSVDVGSNIAYDSDGYMSISEGEDEESVIGDADENPSAVWGVSEASSELSSLHSDRHASLPPSERSEAEEPAVRVKSEADSTAGHVLLDVSANKRKRASYSFGDDKNPRAKRPESHTVDQADFVDLTQWANSD